MALAEGELMDACRQRDDAAWTLVVSGHRHYLQAVARRAGRLDDHAAEDVAQEAFARAYTRLDDLRDDGAFRAWITRTTIRLAVDRARVDRRERPAAAPGNDIADGSPELGDVVALRLAMDGLPQPAREIVERFFLRGESYATIAAAMQLPAGTVASRLNRARARLRAELSVPFPEIGVINSHVCEPDL